MYESGMHKISLGEWCNNKNNWFNSYLSKNHVTEGRSLWNLGQSCAKELTSLLLCQVTSTELASCPLYILLSQVWGRSLCPDPLGITPGAWLWHPQLLSNSIFIYPELQSLALVSPASSIIKRLCWRRHIRHPAHTRIHATRHEDEPIHL